MCDDDQHFYRKRKGAWQHGDTANLPAKAHICDNLKNHPIFSALLRDFTASVSAMRNDTRYTNQRLFNATTCILPVISKPCTKYRAISLKSSQKSNRGNARVCDDIYEPVMMLSGMMFPVESMALDITDSIKCDTDEMVYHRRKKDNDRGLRLRLYMGRMFSITIYASDNFSREFKDF